MSTMKEQIRTLLRKAECSMTALDIHNAVPQFTKQEINKCLYNDMKGEVSYSHHIPPLWTLRFDKSMKGMIVNRTANDCLDPEDLCGTSANVEEFRNNMMFCLGFMLGKVKDTKCDFCILMYGGHTDDVLVEKMKKLCVQYGHTISCKK